MEKNPIYEKLIGLIDEDKSALIELCLHLGDMPSPTHRWLFIKSDFSEKL